MTIQQEVQKLEPGALVDLFELNAVALGGGYLYFHGHLQSGPITFNGVAFAAWPIQAAGFTRSGSKPGNPTLTVGNVDGSIGALCRVYEDMVGAILTRRRTLARFLDAVNFPGGNPTADPTQQMPPEVWFIERKASETKQAVQFELSSAMDFAGVMLPRRQIIANQCSWLYRGPDCGYTGGPVADALDVPTANPALDVCGKRIKSCKMRHGANNPLPFGGYPAAGLMRT